jgi:hypothetical protein
MFSRRRKRPSWAVEPLLIHIEPRGETATDMPVTHINAYSVDPPPALRQKLRAKAHIAVVGPTSHVDGRRAKRFSQSPDIVVLVGDWPTRHEPADPQVPQSAGLAVRLAMHALPRYAREEFQEEAVAILEDGCLDRSDKRLSRATWIIRNLMDLLCSGIRLRLHAKPLYCMPIWSTPDPPDPESAADLEGRLEALLK